MVTNNAEPHSRPVRPWWMESTLATPATVRITRASCPGLALGQRSAASRRANSAATNAFTRQSMNRASGR